MASPRVVVPIEERVSRPSSRSDERDMAWRVVSVIGVLLGVVGWLDWGLLFVPQKFGTAQWEFGTISTSFNALPLATLSAAALATASIAAGRRRTMGALSIFAVLVTLVLIGLAGLFALDVPVLLGSAAPELRPVLWKSIAKTSVFAVVYIVTYAWLALACWRTLQKTR